MRLAEVRGDQLGHGPLLRHLDQLGPEVGHAHADQRALLEHQPGRVPELHAYADGRIAFLVFGEEAHVRCRFSPARALGMPCSHRSHGQDRGNAGHENRLLAYRPATFGQQEHQTAHRQQTPAAAGLGRRRQPASAARRRSSTPPQTWPSASASRAGSRSTSRRTAVSGRRRQRRCSARRTPIRIPSQTRVQQDDESMIEPAYAANSKLHCTCCSQWRGARNSSQHGHSQREPEQFLDLGRAPDTQPYAADQHGSERREQRHRHRHQFPEVEQLPTGEGIRRQDDQRDQRGQINDRGTADGAGQGHRRYKHDQQGNTTGTDHRHIDGLVHQEVGCKWERSRCATPSLSGHAALQARRPGLFEMESFRGRRGPLILPGKASKGSHDAARPQPVTPETIAPSAARNICGIDDMRQGPARSPCPGSGGPPRERQSRNAHAGRQMTDARFIADEPAAFMDEGSDIGQRRCLLDLQAGFR